MTSTKTPMLQPALTAQLVSYCMQNSCNDREVLDVCIPSNILQKDTNLQGMHRMNVTESRQTEEATKVTGYNKD